uniref:Uncharacterized protein n=1 Tax=Chryseobacterium endophyticum TaxID=1854762 RepID=A0AAU6WRQ3_9FLAO
MIKKFIMIGFVCLLSTTGFAQKKPVFNLQPKEDTEVSPIVKEKVDEYAKEIDAIIQEEKN